MEPDKDQIINALEEKIKLMNEIAEKDKQISNLKDELVKLTKDASYYLFLKTSINFIVGIGLLAGVVYACYYAYSKYSF